ncbi:MAG: polysaccharide biosynthesis tyrosine autokinase [candidate division KSB1 bacterium]|nr:polysaccharide biosynthesis tyrosine autokinase [candidate division KSB1 bacterium]MDZ7346696.1 polysaccharide biosynthesis tyrosine autokinase [candidate division KSB1 bacterium]
MNHAQTEIESKEWGLEDYLDLALRRKWIILSVFVAVMAVTIWYVVTRPDIYSASTTFSVDEQTQFSGVNSNARMMPYMYRFGPGKPLEYYNALISSQPFRDKVIQAALNDTVLTTFPDLTTEKILEVLGTLNISKDDEASTLIYMHLKARDPVLVYRLAVICAAAFKDRAREVELEQAQNVVNYVSSQVKQAEMKLEEAEQELQAFKAATKFTIAPDANNSILERLNELENKITEIETKRKLAEANLQTYNMRLKQFEGFSTPSLMEIESAEMLRLRRELDDLEKQKHSLIENGQWLGAKAREVEAAIESKKEEIRKAALTAQKGEGRAVFGADNNEFNLLRERKIAEELNVYSLKNEEQFYRQLRDQFVRQNPNLLENAITLAKLQRSKQVSENLLNFLIQQGEEARIRAQTGTGGLLIVSPAALPMRPLPKNSTRNLAVGFILGLGLGFGLAFVLDFLDQSVRTSDDLVRLCGLPALGTIPSLDEAPVRKDAAKPVVSSMVDGKRNGSPTRSYRLLSTIDSKNPLVEAYRNLRTDLQFINVDDPIRLLMLTSATPSEGKTHTAANLAISYAELGDDVLIVDCDLRKSKLHQIFEVPRTPGVTDFLARDIPLESVIKKTGLSNLYVIPAGTVPPNPAEMLGSLKMEHLIQEVGKRFKLVIFDTPPLMAVSDPKILAPKMQGVLLVVRAGKTNFHLVRDAKDRLEKVDARVVGAVLNAVQAKRGLNSYRYYQYSYYYDYYYADSGEKSKREKASRRQAPSEKRI